MAVKMILLSMLGVMAHNCMFPIMKSQPLAYLLYLMYFRSSRCEQKIDWPFLGLGEDLDFVTAEIPAQASAVSRTFGIAISHMILNVSLSAAAVASLRGY